MGLFGRLRGRRGDAGHVVEPRVTPMHESLDQALAYLDGDYREESLEDRNAYANKILDWARETDDDAERLRDAIFKAEWAIHGRRWVTQSPGRDLDEIVAAQKWAMIRFVRDQEWGRDDWQSAIDRDIPALVARMYEGMVAPMMSRREQRSA
jgi:hypothetical protein